jgi:hypothetical protein
MSQSIIEKLQADNLALTAENAALRVAVDGVNSELYGKGFEVLGWHLNGDTAPLDDWFDENDWNPETPATDAAITELYARGADLFAEHCMKMADGAEQLQYTPTGARWRASARAAKEFAANLRAGTL